MSQLYMFDQVAAKENAAQDRDRPGLHLLKYVDQPFIGLCGVGVDETPDIKFFFKVLGRNIRQ